MDAKASQPRNIFGLIAIALLLGAPSLMLWLGRGWLSFAYLVAGLVLLIGFFAAAITGVLPIEVFAGIDPGTAFQLVYLALALAALVHALAIRRGALARPWYSRWYVALPVYTVLAVAIALPVRQFLLHPFAALSTSMHPSMMLGDYFFVSKVGYRSRDPERGEIAVFRLPAEPNIVFVKRVIGLPGERIQMKNGVLHINDVPVKLERFELAPAFSTEEPVSYYRETLPNGTSHVVADADAEGPADNTEVFTVPEGHYFVMGDNRDNSADSRFAQTGFIPRGNFIGPAGLRFWNDNGVPLSGRP